MHEALVNVLAHAHARQAAVSVRLQGEPAALAIQVSDDGAGFDPSRPTPGRGLAAMRRRTSGLGATLEIAAREGSGTRVSFAIPLRERADEAGAARR